jgi:hypothetical protein
MLLCASGCAQERQKAEKDLRLQAEAATKLANRKVLALSQHIEKLMLHLKHEAASKAKAHEAAGRAGQEVALLKARNGSLLKRSSARDVIILELKEGAKVVETPSPWLETLPLNHHQRAMRATF